MGEVFGAGTVIRRVTGEGALLLGGGRALLLQVAHPAVAQGVADHSDFRRDPVGRLMGTLEASYAVVNSTEEVAERVGRVVQRIHDRVTGPGYRANDPANLHWVHATLVDTALQVHALFVRRLPPDEEEVFYAQMVRVVEFFGCPPEVCPPTLEAFRRAFAQTVDGLRVTDAGREVAAAVLDPAVPLPLRPVVRVMRFVSIGLLPEALRREYGFAWSPGRERVLRGTAAAVRLSSRLAPRAVRGLPARYFTARGVRTFGRLPARKGEPTE